MVTYIAPLAFVLIVTMLKESWDDYQRMLRDKELNLTKYQRLVQDPKDKKNTKITTIFSKDIKVGHILLLKHNTRVPADMLLL